MKYGLGIRMLLSFLAGGVALLYKVRIGKVGTVSEISVIVDVPQQFLFDLVVEPSNTPLWFSWITRLRSNDKRKSVIGKRFRGILNLPFLGQHDIQYKIVDCQEGSWLVLRPENKEKSYFNTEVVLMLSSISKSQTQFYMKIIYGRNSVLFKYTIGPLLKWLTDQQVEKIGSKVTTLALNRWNKLKGIKPAASLDDAANTDSQTAGGKPKSPASANNRTSMYSEIDAIDTSKPPTSIGSVRRYGAHTEL